MRPPTRQRIDASLAAAFEGSFLDSWLGRRTPNVKVTVPPDTLALDDVGGFVWVSAPVALHLAATRRPQSLATSWKALRTYVAEACAIISADAPTWLDREEVSMIYDRLGAPPPQCQPLYFMTVRGASCPERVVYIGKTSSDARRFAGGHAAITKLHAPQYDGLEKLIYPAAIVFLDQDEDYLPIEAVSPYEAARELLGSIEMQLIHNYQPELNSQGKQRCLSRVQLSLHIQSEAAGPFQSHFIDPRIGAQEPMAAMRAAMASL